MDRGWPTGGLPGLQAGSTPTASNASAVLSLLESLQRQAGGATGLSGGAAGMTGGATGGFPAAFAAQTQQAAFPQSQHFPSSQTYSQSAAPASSVTALLSMLQAAQPAQATAPSSFGGSNFPAGANPAQHAIPAQQFGGAAGAGSYGAPSHGGNFGSAGGNFGHSQPYGGQPFDRRPDPMDSRRPPPDQDRFDRGPRPDFDRRPEFDRRPDPMDSRRPPPDQDRFERGPPRDREPPRWGGRGRDGPGFGGPSFRGRGGGFRGGRDSPPRRRSPPPRRSRSPARRSPPPRRSRSPARSPSRKRSRSRSRSRSPTYRSRIPTLPSLRRSGVPLGVAALKARFPRLHIPQDFLCANPAAPVLPLQEKTPSLEVQQSEETSSEVVLQTGPSIQGKVINVKLVLYTGFEPQADVKSTEPLHLAFKFLVGKKKNSLLAFGGQVLPEDGDDFEAESTLIAALRRTCSALFNTELPEEGYQKVCEIQYSRPPEKESSTSVIDITHLYVLPAMHIASSKVTVARQPGGVVPKAISLDGLGDYDLSDVMELSFELSLLAEVIIDSLNITFGSRILEFLQSPNVRLLPKKKEETAAKEPKKPKVDADKAEPPKVEGEQQANSSDQLSVPSEVEKKDEALVAEPTAESVDAKAQQAQQLDAEIIQAFRYFDAGNAGYLLGKDIDSLVLSLTDTFTRRTARDLIATLADYRDRLYYRV